MIDRFWERYAVPQWWTKSELESYLGRAVSDEEWQSFIDWVNDSIGAADQVDEILRHLADEWEEENAQA